MLINHWGKQVGYFDFSVFLFLKEIRLTNTSQGDCGQLPRLLLVP